MRDLLRLLEPGVALVTNRIGDVLAHTDGFERLFRGTGLLDLAEPNLTRYVFTDARARTLFADWGQVADEQAFDVWLGPSAETSSWFADALSLDAGDDFSRRLSAPIPPPRLPWQLEHPTLGPLLWNRETLEVSAPEAQQLVALLPADERTASAFAARPSLRSVGPAA